VLAGITHATLLLWAERLLAAITRFIADS
jgi:hypothetical protein